MCGFRRKSAWCGPTICNLRSICSISATLASDTTAISARMPASITIWLASISSFARPTLMTGTRQPHTHTAYAYQRTGRKLGRFLEVGTGRIDHDHNTAHIVMNRQPIGGYTDYVVLSPHGVKPEPQVRPQRPGDEGDEEETPEG